MRFVQWRLVDSVQCSSSSAAPPIVHCQLIYSDWKSSHIAGRERHIQSDGLHYGRAAGRGENKIVVVYLLSTAIGPVIADAMNLEVISCLGFLLKPCHVEVDLR